MKIGRHVIELNKRKLVCHSKLIQKCRYSDESSTGPPQNYNHMHLKHYRLQCFVIKLLYYMALQNPAF